MNRYKDDNCKIVHYLNCDEEKIKSFCYQCNKWHTLIKRGSHKIGRNEK